VELPVDFSSPLISAEDIDGRVRELAAQINRDYARARSPLSALVVLKGAYFFATDLMRHFEMVTQIDFIQVSSYEGRDSLGEVTLHKDLSLPIGGTDVLLIEDIVDTGLTADWLLRHVALHRPASLRLASLLDKPSRRRVPVTIDYVGFSIPDEFVLGYGLDYDEGYRNLPAVYAARKPGQ
jgi:hypoxanthine phosphoribosyltransferase